MENPNTSSKNKTNKIWQWLSGKAVNKKSYRIVIAVVVVALMILILVCNAVSC